MLGGESFFQNFFKAPAPGGEITVAPELPGDVFTYDMSGEKLMVQSGSFMACETTIELDTKISVKGFVAAEGFSMLEASGTGKLLLSSYGAILEKVLAAGETYIVDTTHLVAFPASMTVTPRAVGGLESRPSGRRRRGGRPDGAREAVDADAVAACRPILAHPPLAV